MSRCFPFPHPGYTRNGLCYEALIESIKLQREKEKEKKAKKDQKKEKRREKKEKKSRERKEKDRTASNGKEFKRNDHDRENEQFERSDITDEHDQPVSSLEPCCLSDSTQSGNKRKRSTSPFSHDHGTVIKIQLPLRKHRQPEESKLEDQLGTTARSVGTADTKGGDHQLHSVTNAERDQCQRNPDSRHCQELPSLVYNSLLQNPPLLTSEGFMSEDQDWLYSSELQEERPVPKKVKSVTGASRCLSPSLWPLAQYLPFVGLYALPYTVPF